QISAKAARIAGNRKAANDSALRSSACDMESVSCAMLCLASTDPMSAIDGTWREYHRPASSAEPAANDTSAMDRDEIIIHLRAEFVCSARATASANSIRSGR